MLQFCDARLYSVAERTCMMHSGSIGYIPRFVTAMPHFVTVETTTPCHRLIRMFCYLLRRANRCALVQDTLAAAAMSKKHPTPAQYIHVDRSEIVVMT